jgi:phospholipid/cholesterol/gamma-HCH transport system ATP-binding protein
VSILEIDSIKKCFGLKYVLKGASFSAEKGEIIGMVGPSGAGKSVLLKIIAGVYGVDGGTCTVGDVRRVGFSFQEGALFDSQTVLENVAFPLIAKEDQNKLSRDEILSQSYETLKAVGLKEAYKKLPAQLSGGMQRRVGIARALVGKPEVILLDDPTSGLDPVSANIILDLVATQHKSYQPTVVIVSHDIRRLLPRVDRVLALFEGEFIFDGAVGDLREQAPRSVIDFLSTRYDFNNH